MLIQIFTLKATNYENKILTHREIIDCMIEQSELVITQMRKFTILINFLI